MVARDYAYAEKLLQNALRQEGTSREALESLGSLYLKSEQFEKALSVYDKLKAIEPENVEILNNLGVIYRRLGRFPESIEVLTEAKRIGTEVETVLYNLGNTYKQMGEYSEAALCFSDVIERKPDDVLAYNHLGSIQALSGRHDMALQSWRRGLQIDPNHPFIHYNMAHSYEILDRPKEAIAEYNAALKTKPGWLDALRDLASLQGRTGDEVACASTLKRILAIDTNDSRAYTEMGQILLKSGKTEDAVVWFRKAIQADSSNFQAVLALVQLFEKQGNLEAALKELEEHDRRNPEVFDVLLHLANLYLKVQQFPEAKQVFRRMDEIHPENVNALRLKGRMYAQLGDSEEAEVCFAKILNIDPTEIDFRIDLAEQLLQSGKLPEAEEQLQAYLKERPRDSVVRLSLGQLYENMKDYDRAQDAYKEVLSRDPQHIDARVALSLLYQQTGKNAEAVRIADEIVNMQGSRASPEDLSNLAGSLDLYEQAVKRYGKSNPAAIGKNLEMLRPKQDELADEFPEDVTPDFGDTGEFIPVDEDTDGLTLADEDALYSDGEMPFDELIETVDEDIGDAALDDETLETLTDFDSPVDVEPENIDSPGCFAEDEEVLGSAGKTGADSLQEEPAFEPSPEPDILTEGSQTEETIDNPISHPVDETENLDQIAFLPNKDSDIGADKIPVPKQSRSQQDEPLPPPVDSPPPPPKLPFAVKNIDADPEHRTAPVVQIVYQYDPMRGLPAEKSPEPAPPEPAEESLPPPTDESPTDEPLADDQPATDEVVDISQAVLEAAEAAREERRLRLGFPLASPVLDGPVLEELLSDLNPHDLLSLFASLKNLALELPESSLSDYLLSAERVKLEYIIERLSGRSGLLDAATVMRYRVRNSGDAVRDKRSEIPLNEALLYLDSLLEALPDQGLGATLHNRLKDIRERIDEQNL